MIVLALQWAATRPDLFPPDVCDSLTLLHSGAPSHSYAYTKQAIEQTFKRPMDDIFSDFEQSPVASGSIAQVHRGVLNDGGAFGSKYKPGTVVAVKVMGHDLAAPIPPPPGGLLAAH